MSENTAIEWCDSTWSPWEGCTKISPGCDHCYAEGMNRWLHKGENWGPGAPRRIYSEDHWDKPIKWQRDAPKFDTLHQRRRRVFPSVCDPFDNEASSFLRGRLFQTIKLTPALDWLLLTKRIGNAARMAPADWAIGGWPPNVWVGATIVNQEEADRDLDKLAALPTSVRFVSYEPALGPVNFSRWFRPFCDRGSVPGPGGVGGVPCPRCGGAGGCSGIDWVIAGGESGPKARPAHPDWFRSLRDQCAAADVPFLFKQWGEWAPHPPTHGFDEGGAIRSGHVRYLQGDGRDPDGHFRRGDAAVRRIGKKAAGRLLDGVQHDGFPEAAHG